VNRPTTIRAQMLTAIGALVLSAMVILVLVTVNVAQRQLYDLGSRDVVAHVQSIAARAGFAAIVGADSPDVAQQLVAESTGVNGILAMQLFGANHRRLASLENAPESLSTCGFQAAEDPGRATTLTRVRSVWCAQTPIFERPSSGDCTADDCIVGHLQVVASTASVDRIVWRLITAIVIAGVLVLSATLLLLWHLSTRISSPLLDIVAVMRRFVAGDRTARATGRGPEEIITISHVYNELISAQEEQSRHLERTVEERTRQLKSATLAAQDAERYKSTFMAHISHDMRTPLHLIRSQAADVINELEFGADLDRCREFLERIIRQSSELALRVAQVLELTRGESGHAPITIGPVSMEELRAALIDQAEALARQNGNTLSFLADSGEISTDIDKVLQISTNLIENACKFTSHGIVTVTLRRQLAEFIIEVTDTGMGVPPEELPHIWSEFRQVQSPRDRSRGGFGLGLAIVRLYTTLLGGRYGAESEVGCGTRVWVNLPAMLPGAVAEPLGEPEQATISPPIREAATPP